MTKITKLTPEQEARKAEFTRLWTEIGLSTAAADRPRAEAAIAAIYAGAGLPTPKIVWCGSPLSQGMTRAIILDKKFAEKLGQLVEENTGKKIAPGDSVGASVGASVRARVGDSVWDSMRASVRDSVRASVWASVRASVRASVGDSVWDSVRDSVRASVRASVWASVRDSVWDSVWDSVRASVRASVWDSVWDSVRDSVWDSVRASVWDSVRDSVWASVWDSVSNSGYGQHDAHWLGFIEYFRNVCGLTAETDKAQGLIELAKSAGWFLPHQNICWVSERHHILERDDRGRLHSLTGPAVAYPDGWAIYAVHGVRLPAWIIEHPEHITVAKIDAESNAEVRRVMIERYGADKYMLDCGAKPIQRDRSGILYRKTMPDDEDLVMVRVLNSTPEPDGVLTEAEAREVFGNEVVDENLSAMRRIGFKSKDKELLKRPRFKEYFLRVPPQMQTAHEAVAWTYGMETADFSLLLQT